MFMYITKTIRREIKIEIKADLVKKNLNSIQICSLITLKCNIKRDEEYSISIHEELQAI